MKSAEDKILYAPMHVGSSCGAIQVQEQKQNKESIEMATSNITWENTSLVRHLECHKGHDVISKHVPCKIFGRPIDQRYM